ncbi:MAG: hypothetical protein KDA84_01845 [Planctomycetaceae bacterium]|nr:hypothetical protein [Planctomycetaceae bacterium]
MNYRPVFAFLFGLLAISSCLGCGDKSSSSNVSSSQPRSAPTNSPSNRNLSEIQFRYCIPSGDRPARSLAFSSGGTQLFSGSKTLNTWNLDTGRCFSAINAHKSAVEIVVTSPDSKQIATCGDLDPTIKIWDAATKELIRSIQTKGHLQSLAWSPDGKQLASCDSVDHTIQLWNAQTGVRLGTLPGHGSATYQVAFHPNGTMLLSCGMGYKNRQLVRDAKVWDLATAEETLNLHANADYGIFHAAYNRAGTRIVTAARVWELGTGQPLCQIKLWDARTGKLIHDLKGFDGFVHSIVFTPDGLGVFAGGDRYDQAARKPLPVLAYWNTATGQKRHVFSGHNSGVQSVAVSPDGQTLASGSQENTIKLWDRKSGACVNTFHSGHHQQVKALAVDHRGRLLATGGSDRVIQVWGLATGEGLVRLEGHTQPVSALAFSPDGKLLASGSEDTTVKLWDWETGNCVATFTGHTDVVKSVAFSRDGKSLASCTGDVFATKKDKTVRLWDVSKKASLRVIDTDCLSFNRVTFTRDEKSLLLAGREYNPGQKKSVGKLQCWSIKTGQKLFELPCETKANYEMALSPDGNTVAVGGAEPLVELWNLATQRREQTHHLTEGWVTGLAFDPTGGRLTICNAHNIKGQLPQPANRKNSIRTIDLPSRETIFSGNPHWGGVWEMAADSSGQFLITSGQDNTINVWEQTR